MYKPTGAGKGNEMRRKVLFLVKDRNPYGNSYSPPFGLLYSARFVATMLEAHKFHTKVVQVTDGNSIDKEVTNFNADVVVIEALWVTPEKLDELLGLARHKHRRWVVRLHSKPSFLSLEGNAMDWMCKMTALALRNHKFSIAVNNKQAEMELDSVFRADIKLLPNYYISCGMEARPQKNREELHVGCFGALRPLKNTLEQALASIIYANDTGRSLRFYVNSTRIEQHAEPVLKNLRGLFSRAKKHKLVEVPWISHLEFLNTVARMNLGLQVSFSESFNIVAADFAAVGTPIVVSPEIDWMPNDFKANPTDAFDIVKKMRHIEHMIKWCSRRAMRKALERYDRESTERWLRFLN